MGAWRHNGICIQKFPVDPEDEVYQLDEDKKPPTEWMRYRLKRLYFKSKSSPDLKVLFFSFTVSIIKYKYVTYFAISDKLRDLTLKILQTVSFVSHIVLPSKRGLYPGN